MDLTQFSSIPYYRQFVQHTAIADAHAVKPRPSPPYPSNATPIDLTMPSHPPPAHISRPSYHQGYNPPPPVPFGRPAYFSQEITIRHVASVDPYAYPYPLTNPHSEPFYPAADKQPSQEQRKSEPPANQLRFAIYEGILSTYVPKPEPSSPENLYSINRSSVTDDVGYSSVSDLSSANSSDVSTDRVSSDEPSLMDLLDDVSDSCAYFKDIMDDLDDRHSHSNDTPMSLPEPQKDRSIPKIVIKKSESDSEPKSTCMVSPKFPCDICGDSFISTSRLRSHMTMKHGKLRRHVCTICNKAFAQKTTLRTHLRVHTGERPFKCRMCPKAFADYSTCAKHERTHTGERPYACPVCGKAFAQSGNMIRHKQTHDNVKRVKKSRGQ